MNEKNKNFEKRVNQRYNVKLPLSVGTERFQFESITKNISCSGVYCKIDFFLSLMTKLEVKMNFSVVEDNKKVEKTFTANAVIVRIDPEYDQPGCEEYHVALFFMGLKDENRDTISLYIQQTFLASNN